MRDGEENELFFFMEDEAFVKKGENYFLVFSGFLITCDNIFV